jgi:estrogen-related receptor beta like 1
MWENALEKLKVLNYESGFCQPKGKKAFTRIHFVYPGKNSSQQFDDFIDICSWLCFEISQQSDLFSRDQYDDPNTVSNKLMLAMRQLEFKSSFPSQKLKLAHGEAVCTVLEFLTDKALASKGFKWGIPVYTEADEVIQIPKIT